MRFFRLGICAILSQRKIERDLPIAYAFRTFNAHVQNYSTMER